MTINRIVKKFGKILTGHQKLRIFELGVLMVIGGFFETCSVALILPFMNAVMNSAETMDQRYVQFICDIFGLDSAESFLAFMGVVLAVLYIFKNIYLLFEYSIQYRFVYGNMFEIQKKLLHAFTHRSYEHFLRVNSGEMVRIINSDTGNAFNLLMTFLALSTELLVSGMLIISIFVIAPVATVGIALLLGSILLAIYLIIRPILQRAGMNIQKSGSGMNKWLLQSIQGIKEIKVMKEEDFFEGKYNEFGRLHVSANRWSQTLMLVPRFMIEGVCMGAMFLVVSLMIKSGSNFETIIPILTAVAMAAVRLLPSINRISNALSQMAYGEPMLDKVLENLDMFHEGELDGKKVVDMGDGRIGQEMVEPSSSFGWDISLNGVSYKYPGSESYVLEKVSAVIHKGESIGIVGPSGAGKTTAVDLILGLLKPMQGSVRVDGKNIETCRNWWLDQVGYIPQVIFMLDGSIRENVIFGEVSDGVDEGVWRALREAALDDFVKGLSDGLDTQIGERGVRLSGGQRQRIGIARALYRNPKVLIFDEATSSLDQDTENAIMDSIHKLKGQKTIIIIAHRLSTIESCDHILRVEGGKINVER